MKTSHIIGLALGAFALVINQTLGQDYIEDDIEIPEVSTLRSFKDLSPEELELANQARAHIAKAIEDNIVRLLAVVRARGDRRPRQEDEDDTDAITPNPNVLPQVAQILGAIFTGSLNISRVVDRTFGLVPNIVRNQVGGIVKLINGDNKVVNETKAEATSAVPPPSSSTAGSVKQTTKEPAVLQVKSPEQASTETPAAVETTLTPVPSPADGSRGKYRIRNRTRGSTTSTKTPLEDDEIDKAADDIEQAEEELRQLGQAYAPATKDQNPRQLASIFKNVMSRIDFNSTEIAAAVPSIFKGTQQAFKVLENLGILDVNDVLDELDLPTLEEEEDDD